uniref:Uncharacterized protein n=1 Tax=Aegilops tauschii subsp. strangulata TaxID=200361 RepID=A0A453NDP3_AEGTS
VVWERTAGLCPAIVRRNASAASVATGRAAARAAFPDPADLPAASAYNRRLSPSLRPPAHPQVRLTSPSGQISSTPPTATRPPRHLQALTRGSA